MSITSLSKVFTDGNLVDVNIRMWTGERTLQPEDLGLKGEHISEAFKLGKKSLIPVEVTGSFRRLDQKARLVLSKHSFAFAFGGSRFVPKKTFLKFAEEFEEVRIKFNEEVKGLIDNYDRYKLEMRTHYIAAAKEAHKRVVSMRKIDVNLNEFVNEFIARVETFYPPKEKLIGRFSMDYVVFQVALPDLTRASYDDLIEEDEKIKMLQMAKHAELQERVRSFVEDTVSGMREKASSALSHLEASVRGHKKITKASIKAVLNMIEDYVSLDIIGDDVFIHHMVHFRDKHLKFLSDRVLKQKPDFADFICKELRNLVTMAEDLEVITMLVKSYQNKIEV